MIPEPTSERFRPLRSGLINLYKYEDQEFWFHEGRLLLRGNNGTGKSRVLALQLPFLFDGEISSHRVEPDGDSARAMAWHLLMNEYDDRLGYTWIEFGRRLPDGTAIYVTLGCGMRATKGSEGLRDRWYFVTSRRVGQDFGLLTTHRQPLTRDQLAEHIGEAALFDRVQSYRQKVDEALFGLKLRYDALIELLIRLRAPQLARKLDEDRLSGALSDALPPLSEGLLKDVADSFGNLDTIRGDLQTHRDILRTVGDFLSDYQGYLQVAASRRSESIRTLHSQYEDAHSKLSGVRRDKTAAEAAIVKANEALHQAKLDETAAQSQLDALKDSEYQKDATDLQNARSQAEQWQREFQSQETKFNAVTSQVAEAEKVLTEEETRTQGARSGLENYLLHARKAAEGASFATDHDAQIPRADNWPADRHWIKTAERALADRCRQRERVLEQLKQIEDSWNEKRQKLQGAQTRETEAEQRVSEERALESALDAALVAASDSVVQHYRRWHGSLTWLHPVEPAIWEESLQKWLETGAPADRRLPGALEEAMTTAEGERRHALALVQTEIDGFDRQIVELQREEDELKSGRHLPPAVPTTRDPAVRSTVRGAPLWEVCDFSSQLTLEERAGLEAALEAAGLLDALITPAGELVPAHACDSFVSSSVLPSDGPDLTQWLQPSVPDNRSDELDVAAVMHALARISAGAGTHYVDLQGGWQLGPVRGRGRKALPQHIGHGSREAARQRRLAQITEELAAVNGQLGEAQQRKVELETVRVEQLRQERATAPDDQGVAGLLGERSTIRQRLESARRAYVTAQGASEAARLNYQKATEERTDTYRDLQLLAWEGKLAELREAWQQYAVQLSGFWPTARHWEDARDQLSRAQQSLVLLRGNHAGAQQSLNETEQRWTLAQTRYETLQASVGASVEELERQVNAATNALQSARNQAAGAQTQLSGANTQLEVANIQIAQFEKQVEDLVNQRTAAIDRLRLFVHHGLFADTHAAFATFEAEPWSVTRAVEIAREVDRALSTVKADDNAWRNRQGSLMTQFTDLQTSLGGRGYQPQMDFADEGLFVVTCPFHGGRMTLGQLHAAVADEISTQERVLTEREREVIDNHLIGEVATALQELIRSAEDRVKDMNDEIVRCSTSTGFSMRLKWEPRTEEIPDGLPAARKLLLGDPNLWTPEERNQLGLFLHGLIKEARENNPLGLWADHLRHALDYRNWHRFSVERRQNDKWEKLTKRRYGTGSGGEKALMLTVPQMAAAAAHYRSAAPYAPRLILLDEVFVGIDSKVRAKCMGLLEAFDLDFVMTSEREWGAYPTIKGLAIYQLTTHPGIDAVGATRWVWNGRQKLLANPEANSHSGT